VKHGGFRKRRSTTRPKERSSKKFAICFEESFTHYANQNQGLIPFSVEQVHNGYFSSDKKGAGKEKKEVWIDSKEKNTKADEDTYSLIMQEKERLLSLEEPSTSPRRGILTELIT
jgi:type III restriction enzyme